MIVFGNATRIALPVLGATKSPISQTVFFTHPTIGPFFSRHGFAFPLSLVGLPFDVMMDNTAPAIPKHLKSLMDPTRYILIDHAGLMWNVVIQHAIEPDDEQLYISCAYIPYQYDGWWIASMRAGEHNPDKDMLLGFLYTNPNEKAINDYWYAQNTGKGLNWLNIADIVAMLNAEYPKSNQEEKNNGLESREH